VSLTSKYNNHLRKAIPLREHFLTVKETVKENVPVDTDSGIHKLLLLLKFSCKWCILYEHNFTQSAPYTTANQLNCKHIICNSQLV
jgi:hypothetical protein